VNYSQPLLQVTKSLAAQQTHNQTNTHTHKARKQEDPKTHNSIIYKQISVLLVLCCVGFLLCNWFCPCGCVCVCVSLSLSLSLCLYIDHSCWAVEVGVGEWGNRISSTKSRQRIVLKRFKNTPLLKYSPTQNCNFYDTFNSQAHEMFAETVCLTITTTTTTIIICLFCLSDNQLVGGGWTLRERERERENTKLSKWSLVVTLLPWLEFGS